MPAQLCGLREAVTALAGRPASQAHRHAASLALAVIALAATSSPSMAQAAAAVSVYNDYRHRGISLSAGRPAAIADLSYDSSSGFYGAVSGSLLATRHDGIRPLGLQLNGGYAKRLRSEISMDFGLIHSIYSEYSSRAQSTSYTEAYAGLSDKLLTGRIYLSPNYIRSGEWSAYGELDAKVALPGRMQCVCHVGVLMPLGDGGHGYSSQFDWKLGASRSFGDLSVLGAWTGAHPQRDLHPGEHHRGNAVVLGLTYVF